MTVEETEGMEFAILDIKRCDTDPKAGAQLELMLFLTYLCRGTETLFTLKKNELPD